MAHKVKITKGDTFRLNPTVCKPTMQITMERKTCMFLNLKKCN
jgi:hypothetical protein